ncbi:MAG TPA: DUF1059 domain-containing protein [Candidatus Baltobacteraceae bacterium]
MAQQFVFCRDFIDDGDCSVALGADNLEDLVELAVEHAHGWHGEEDSQALRAYIRQNVRDTVLA